MGTIADRVREALARAGRKQNETASEVGMTADALSRALSGSRGFGAVELSEIARYLGADVHWLITGEEDPYRFAVSARHSYDPLSRERSVSGAIPDQEVIDGIALAYEQVGALVASSMPADVDELREALGSDFVGTFVETLSSLDVDVVRVEQLSTAYSFTLAGRAVIAINSSGNWFHQNWSLAHELGHLVAGDTGVMPSHNNVDVLELNANQFAAELLLPAAEVRAVDWATASCAELAAFIWDRGVSTAALRHRLSTLDITVSSEVGTCLQQNTQRVLRHHHASTTSSDRDIISERMQSASQRLFPAWLVGAHVDAIADGSLGKATLAWMLDIDEDALELDEPERPKLLGSEALAALFT